MRFSGFRNPVALFGSGIRDVGLVLGSAFTLCVIFNVTGEIYGTLIANPCSQWIDCILMGMGTLVIGILFTTTFVGSAVLLVTILFGSAILLTAPFGFLYGLLIKPDANGNKPFLYL